MVEKSEIFAEVGGRGVGCHHGGFPEKSARAAEGIAEDVFGSSSREFEDGGGEGFLERGFDGAGSIAPFKKRSACGVEADGGFIFEDEDVELDSGIVDFNGGAVAGFFAEDVADGVFDNKAGKVAVAEFGVVGDVGVDGKRFIEGEIVSPGDFFSFVVESFAVGAIEMRKRP